MKALRWAGLWSMLPAAAAAAGGPLPGTLNFQDVTAERIVQTVAETASNEKAVEAGDFDNDGDLDVVIAVAHSDFGTRRNKLYRNDGGVFLEISGPPAIPEFASSVGGAGGRPTILRNTSVLGGVSFVDWTPAPAFPTGLQHEGWHAAILDADGDGDRDLFLGGWSGDHLFDQVPEIEHDEADLPGGAIPDVFNQDPAAVVGSIGAGDADTYAIGPLPAEAFLSVVLNGADDYRLEILDAGGPVLLTVDRGGVGVEEAAGFDPPSMPPAITVRVTGLACANPSDVAGDCGVGIVDLVALLADWGRAPGSPGDLDGDGVVGILDLVQLLGDWGPSDYVLEVLARDDV